MKFSTAFVVAFLAATSTAHVASSSAPASSIAEVQDTASVAAQAASVSTTCTTSHSLVSEELSVAPKASSVHFGPIYPEISSVAGVPAHVSSAPAVSLAPLGVHSQSSLTSEVDTTSTKTVQITITLTKPLSQSPKASPAHSLVAGVYPPANVSAPATATVQPVPAGSPLSSEHAVSNGTSHNSTAAGSSVTGSPVLPTPPAVPGYVSGSFKLAHATASMTLIAVGLSLLTL